MVKVGKAGFQLESLNFDNVNCFKTEEIIKISLSQTEDYILREKEETVNLIKNIEKDYANRNGIRQTVESLLQRQNSLSEKQNELQSLFEKKKREKEKCHLMNEIRKNKLSLYEKYLALEIKRVRYHLETKENGYKDLLLFSFHNINKTKPQDTYTFEITTDGVIYEGKFILFLPEMYYQTDFV
ncbi:uncharacterized protein LOC118179681 [Stegodyphus dumicola]|uniref:uncharacterized protein LOC118179681 n=1 Tax=Stegodyphus dumicola TaxID=202533 RepID=UPI0015A8956D|nr:uncharacterized protein LOC118179681 [Stegodyphus dumicola]